MITIDGAELRTSDITIAHLYCGCVKFYAGHDVKADHLALCADPDNHLPAQGHSLTAIERAFHTTMVG